MHSLTGYCGGLDLSNLQLAPAPSGSTKQPDLSGLSSTFTQAMSQDWSMPRSTRPLNEAELTFLRSHTVVEIGGRAESTSNPFMRFIVNVVKQTVTQLAVQFAQEAVKDALMPKQDPKPEAPKRTISRGLASVKSDPSVDTLKKIATHDIQSRATSVGMKLLKDEFVNEANKEFVQHMGTSLGVSLKSAQFLQKAAEEGFQSAVAHTAGSITTDYILKKGVDAAFSFIGCTNPVFCAKLVVTVVKDLFIGTETAPPSSDMYGHYPSIQFPPPDSYLPPLNPNLGPAFRAPQ